MLVNRYKFYFEIVYGDKPINYIFSNLSTLTPNEYGELYNEFSLRINHGFDLENFTNQVETAAAKPNYPSRIKTRVRLAIILLSVCALGTTFDENVYSYTLDFVLKKELCLLPISQN